MKSNKILPVLGLMATLTACESFLDVDPVGNILLIDEALQTPQDYENLLNSCYDVVANYKNGRIQVLNDLLSDDLAAPNNNSDFNEVYNRNMLFFNGTIGGVYGEPYIAIMRSNSLLDALADGSTGLDAQRQTTMEAECKFIRALGHFDLVTGWAQPAGFTADNSHAGIAVRAENNINDLPQRESVQAAYNLIIADLMFAKDNLPATNGNYATSHAAEALLAKVYFQLNDFANAALYAGNVINSGVFSLEVSNTDTANRFVEGGTSTEAIFSTISSQLDQRSGSFTGNYRTDLGNEPTIRASLEMYVTYGLDSTDQRSRWFTVFNEGESNEYIGINKFNRQFFSVPVLHLTEMKLIRAEALAALGSDLATAIQDVNDIRERAYGGPQKNLAGSAGASAILTAVRFERRIEMLGEGNRVQQLKRRGANGESITIRNAPWNCPGMVLQFPVSELTDIFPLNETGGC